MSVSMMSTILLLELFLVELVFLRVAMFRLVFLKSPMQILIPDLSTRDPFISL